MIARRVGRVQAFPAHQLGAPGHIGVFAIDEEIGIEEFAVERNIFDHLAAVKRGRGSGAEDIFVIAEVAVIHFLAAAVEMPQHWE